MTDFAPFPMPNDQILGGTCVASVWYNEDDYDAPMVTVVVLMPEAPFYRVGTAFLRPTGIEWENEPEVHYNIVPAINSEQGYDVDDVLVKTSPYGYVDLGGDY